jgi:hypothetical protein
MQPWSQLRQFLDRDVREGGQLIVVRQKHVTAELDSGGEVEGVGQPIALRLSGRDGRVCMTTTDSASPDMHRGSQAQRPQVRLVKEPEKVRQPLTAAWAKDRDQTFCAGQLADRESMASLFECVQVVFRPLLVGGVALNGVDDDHGVQVVQQSWPPRRGAMASGFLFAVPLVVLGLARLFFGL